MREPPFPVGLTPTTSYLSVIAVTVIEALIMEFFVGISVRDGITVVISTLLGSFLRMGLYICIIFYMKLHLSDIFDIWGY